MALLEILTLGIRALQFVFAIIVLGLTGHGQSFSASSSPPQTSNPPANISQSLHMAPPPLKTPSSNILIRHYLGLSPKFFPSLSHGLIHFVLDALTTLFWFSGFIALAVFDRNLHRDYYFFGVYYAGYGDACDAVGYLCPVITAAVVFGAFEWYVGSRCDFAGRRGRKAGRSFLYVERLGKVRDLILHDI